MLEQVLMRIIPKDLKTFHKLVAGRDPYYFGRWDKGKGGAILRYWFWSRDGTEKNKKRVFVHELESLLRHTHQAKRITRYDFEQYCPRTNRDGSCGFAVIIRILEFLQVIIVDNGEYRVKGGGRVRQLLN